MPRNHPPFMTPSRQPTPSTAPSTLTDVHVKKRHECPNIRCAIAQSHDFVDLRPHPSCPSGIQKITINRFIADANPFPNLNRWEVTGRAPQSPLRDGKEVFVEIFGVLTLRKIESTNSEWEVFSCTDKDEVVRLEVVARVQWCAQNQGWFPFSFLC
jgi:hypothetical protein